MCLPAQQLRVGSLKDEQQQTLGRLRGQQAQDLQH
jgi:hypothetical protein